MFRRANEPSTEEEAASNPRWVPAPGEAPDTCFRCGKPTPLGVSLCAVDNPGHVKSPSSTQVHGTIALGVIGGFIAFMLLASAVSGGVGPFPATITGQATQPDGGLEIVLRVTNEGSRLAAASCRVSRGGIQSAHDLVFFTEPIPPGEWRDFSRVFPPPDGAAPRAGSLAVRCN
jgi:hypothetical protein